MRLNRLVIIAAMGSAITAPASASVLMSDQDLDAIFMTRDLNGDGDAADPGETTLFFGDGNASGLATPTGNVFAMQRATDGAVYFGDGATDTVYRAQDLNHDKDAMDAGEASVWFSNSNAGGLPLLTPNGVAQGGDGAIYIVEADVVSTPNGDFVYRTVDLNNDGDANDAGEAAAWLDLKALNPSSSAFEITFDGDTAYVIDSAGTDTNRIYRAADTDSSGIVDSSEVSIFIDETNPFGVQIDFAMALDDDGSVLTVDLTGSHQIFELTDLDDSGSIDAAAEAVEIWNDSFLPAGFDALAVFDIIVDDNGDIFLVSNAGGSSPEGDSIYRLTDIDDDGLYFGPGETVVWNSRAINGEFPSRGRALAAYDQVPAPGSLSLLAGAFALLGVAGRKRRRGQS